MGIEKYFSSPIKGDLSNNSKSNAYPKEVKEVTTSSSRSYHNIFEEC